MCVSLLASRKTETYNVTYDHSKTILICFHETLLISAAHFMLNT